MTPTKFPISVNGGMQDRQAKGVHDRLHARCLVLDDGTTKIALVVCDSCMIPRDHGRSKGLAQGDRHSDEPYAHLGDTHPHRADAARCFQSEPDPDYPKYLAAQIARGIARRTPTGAGAVGWGVGRSRINSSTGAGRSAGQHRRRSLRPHHRQGEDEPRLSRHWSDWSRRARSIRKCRFCRSEPVPASHWLCWRTTRCTMSAASSHCPLIISRVFAERIGVLLKADKTEPPFVGILSNGTSGDMNNINFAGSAPGKSEPFEQIRIVADAVARAAAAAEQKIKYHTWVPLKMIESEIELGVRLPKEKEVAEAKEIMAAAKGPVLRSLRKSTRARRCSCRSSRRRCRSSSRRSASARSASSPSRARPSRRPVWKSSKRVR